MAAHLPPHHLLGVDGMPMSSLRPGAMTMQPSGPTSFVGIVSPALAAAVLAAGAGTVPPQFVNPRSVLSRPRHDVRDTMSEKELREAATMADQGIPLPRTVAHERLEEAKRTGDFATANAIVAGIKGWAPQLHAAADRARLRVSIERAAKIGSVTRQERARVKRERRASKHHNPDEQV